MEADFHHSVLFYGDADEFLAGTVPFLRAALDAGQPALVAVTCPRAEMLKAELGESATLAGFAPMDEVGRNPARIIPFWRDFLDRHGGDGRPRGIGEPTWPGRGPAEIDECRRHESLLNLAFGGAPAWSLLCPYDSASLDDEVLEAAAHSHPFLHGGEASGRNPAWLDEGAGPFAGELSAPPVSARSVRFARATLHDARALVGSEAERVRLSPDREFDLVAAAGELVANSVMHGGGGGLLRVWEEGDALLVEVGDAGLIEEPLVGRLRPLPTQDGGRGLWLANHLCDLVQVRSGREGTIVRLHMGLDR